MEELEEEKQELLPEGDDDSDDIRPNRGNRKGQREPPKSVVLVRGKTKPAAAGGDRKEVRAVSCVCRSVCLCLGVCVCVCVCVLFFLS